jgi:hypothetical protein
MSKGIITLVRTPLDVERNADGGAVNPQAVCQEGMDIFTANRRSILYMTHKVTGLPVAFVAIGALLVGSIGWTHGGVGSEVKRADELGYVHSFGYLFFNDGWQVFCLWGKHGHCAVWKRAS